MANDLESQIRVRLSSDRLTATLQIDPGTVAALVSEQTLLGIITGRGIQHNDALHEVVERVLSEFDPESTERYECVVANGVPSRPGENGRFVLAEDLEEIRERAKRLRTKRLLDAESDADAQSGKNPGPVDEDGAADPSESGEAIDHYIRSTLMLVEPGQVIGQILPNTPGTNGVDACGVTILARDGVPCSITIDPESIKRSSDGKLIALRGGLLDVQEQSVAITDTLVIKGFVDFSTGHVSFKGDISVRKGVRDKFCVDARRSLEIHDLVEAATIRAGRDITLLRGMAGREKGEADAGRDLSAKYLDACRVRVGRDLRIERELTNCSVVVARDAACDHATMVGGCLTVAGIASFAQIGSESGTPTIIRLGRFEAMEPLLRQGLQLYPKVCLRLDQIAEETGKLHGVSGRVSASLAEQLTELQFAASTIDRKRLSLHDSLRTASNLVKEHTTCTLSVRKRLMHDTEIRAAGWIARIMSDLKGPLTISVNDEGELVVRDDDGSAPRPLSRHARITPDPSAVRLEDIDEMLQAA